LSKPALDRLRKALVKEQERARPRPRDLSRLRNEIARLGPRIDNAEDVILGAPPDLRPGLYRKLEELIEEWKRLTTEIETLSRYNASENDSPAEIERAMRALGSLSEALGNAKPEDTKELLASIVTKIELYYDHKESESGRKTSEFTHGLIYVRPDANEDRSTGTTSPLMSKKGSILDTSHASRLSGTIGQERMSNVPQETEPS